MPKHIGVFSLARTACPIPDIACLAGGMSVMANELTEENDRETSVLFRLSRKQKAQLHAEAKALGIPLQALMERRLLGKHDATRRPPGRTPKAEQPEAFFEKKELMAS